MLSLAESFARDAARMRSLARTLVACDQTADDLVQDAFVAAAERPPRHATSLANWLAVVIRNRARTRLLRESRRRRHERNAASPDRQPDRGFDRMELLRVLIQAVQELQPASREVIVLRFFEDLPPRDIARRLGIPVATVRTRIRRGLETLRGRLDTEGGGRDAWVSSFLPLAMTGSGAASPAAASSASGTASTTGATTSAAPKSGWAGLLKGAVGMQMQLNKSLAVAGLLLLALTAGLLVSDPDWTTPGPDEFGAAEEAAPLSHGTGETKEDARVDAAPSAADPSGSAATRVAAAAIATPSTTVRGRVIQRNDRRPVPDVELLARIYRPTHDVAQLQAVGEPAADGVGPVFETLVRSDATGAFSFDLPNAPDDAPDGASSRADTLWKPTLAGRIRFEVVGREWTHRAENMHLRQGVLNGLDVEVVRLDAEVEGRVTDEGGKPIASATVRVGFEQTTTTTDAEGNYRLRYPSRNGRLELSVLARGFGIHETEVQLEQGREGPFRHDVQLPAARILRGRVVNAEDQPVPGAVVCTGLVASHTRTDSEGFFTIDWTPSNGPSAPSWVYARAAGHLDGRAEIAADPSDLRIELAPATPVSGMVVDRDGAPVVGAAIYIRPENTNNREADAITGTDGRFEGFTSPRWKSLTVDAAGFALARFGLDHEPDGNGIDLGRLVLSAGRAVSGRVLDAAGHPLSGVGVFGRMRKAGAAKTSGGGSSSMGLLTITDGHGRFTLRDMPIHGLSLNFVERGYLPQRVDPVPATVTVALQRQGGVAGRVIDGRSRAPIEAFRIRLAVSDRGDKRIRGWRATWEEGRAFRSSDGTWSSAENRFPEGHWLGVSATAPGYAPSPFRSIRTRGHPTPEDCVIELWPGGTVTGRCVDPTGVPIEGASVVLYPSLREGITTGHDPHAAETRDLRAMRSMATTSDDRGAFSFAPVSPGHASLLATVTGRPRVFLPAILVPREGSAAPLTITLPAGATVEGTVLGDRAAWNVASVALIPQAPEPGQRRRVEAALTEDGRYRAEGLAPGSYDLLVERSAGANDGPGTPPPWSRPIEIRPGAERLVEDIDLTAEGAGSSAGARRGF